MRACKAFQQWCLLAKEQCVVCATGHVSHTSLFQLLDVCGSCLVLEGARAQLPTVVCTPSAHCCVCHSHCMVPASCHAPYMLHSSRGIVRAQQAGNLTPKVQSVVNVMYDNTGKVYFQHAFNCAIALHSGVLSYAAGPDLPSEPSQPPC